MKKDDILTALNMQFSLNKESSKIVVVGMGITGLSVAYFLRSLGLQFAIVDSRKKPPINDELLAEMPDVAVFTGGFDQAAYLLVVLTRRYLMWQAILLLARVSRWMNQ